MKYQIKISYRTGNSFGRHVIEDFLDLKWENLEIAKENLKAIEQHWKFYSQIENHYSSRLSNQEVFEFYKNKWWFAGRKDRWFVDLSKNSGRIDWVIIDRNKKNLNKYKNYPNELRWDEISHISMKLKTDEGKLMQQSNFWCGYFETLYGAKIVPREDSGLSFEV